MKPSLTKKTGPVKKNIHLGPANEEVNLVLVTFVQLIFVMSCMCPLVYIF